MTKIAKNRNNRLLYDLVDIAILPAALLICAKVLGIAMLNSLLNLDWSIQSVTDAFFSLRPGYSAEDALLVNSYTNLFMFVIVFAGCLLVTGKSLLFNHKKASPHFVLKLAKYDLLHLLKSSIHLYKEAFVWGVFLIITTVYLVVSFLMGETYAWIAGLSFVFTAVFLWILVQSIEEEILFHNYK